MRTASFSTPCRISVDARSATRELLRVFVTHPLLTLKVVAGIHLEALLIWLKGVSLHVRPPPPDRPVTVVIANQNEKDSVPCQI